MCLWLFLLLRSGFHAVSRPARLPVPGSLLASSCPVPTPRPFPLPFVPLAPLTVKPVFCLSRTLLLLPHESLLPPTHHPHCACHPSSCYHQQYHHHHHHHHEHSSHLFRLGLSHHIPKLDPNRHLPSQWPLRLTVTSPALRRALPLSRYAPSLLPPPDLLQDYPLTCEPPPPRSISSTTPSSATA